MELGYARQVLDLAVESFVADTGSLQDRLCAAYVSHLIKLREEDFTPELWIRFGKLKKAVTMYTAKGDEGVVKANIHEFMESQARLIGKVVPIPGDVTDVRPLVLRPHIVFETTLTLARFSIKVPFVN